MSYDVFISYRHEGADSLAQLIYSRLSENGYRVFLDRDSLRGGKFNEKLLHYIEECNDVILILPPNALERCDDPEDWLYQEITHAIENNKNIIPIMMEKFEWPKFLPEGLKTLPDYNGIHHSKDFVNELIDRIFLFLNSKPDKKGFQKAKKLEKRKLLINQLMKGKSILMIGLTLAVMIGAVFTGYRYYTDKMEAAERSTITFQLVASDEMSASEYYDAVETVEERIRLFTGGEKYTFEISEDVVKIRFDIGLLHEIDPTEFLQCYISRPMDLYLLDTSSQVLAKLEREDIVSMEFLQGPNEQIDLSTYEMEDVKDYTYAKIHLSQQVLDEIVEKFGSLPEELWLAQDIEVNQRWFYYQLTNSSEPNEYFFIDTYQLKGIEDVIEFNYTNEAFSKAFTISVEFPVDWEKVEELETAGSYQCNVEDLPENYVTIQYKAGKTDIPEGMYLDAVAAMKERLDALEIPYAFGYTLPNEYDVSVRTSSEHLSRDIVKNLNSNFALKLENPFSYAQPYLDKETLSYRKNEDGTYSIVYEDTSNYGLEEINQYVDEIIGTSNPNIYLTFDGYSIAEANVMENEAEIRAGKIVFDNFNGFKDPSINEQEFFFKFLEVYLQKDSEHIFYDCSIVAENPDEEYGIQLRLIEHEKESYEKIIHEILPDSEVKVSSSYGSNGLYITVNESNAVISENELPDLIKNLYEQCELKSGKIRNTVIDGIKFDGTEISIQMKADPLEHHQMVLHVWSLENGENNPKLQKFMEILEEDPYFKQELLLQKPE